MSGPSAELLWPCGDPETERHGTAPPAGWYIAVGYDQEYHLGVHTGLDISIPGEEDFGAGCYAVAAGEVAYATACPGSWGNVVMIEHRDVAGFTHLWSQYAHLASVEVKVGQRVEQGQRIGTVGHGPEVNGRPRFSAHLHFELRREYLSACYWPSGKDSLKTPAVHATVRRAYVDPNGLLGR